MIKQPKQPESLIDRRILYMIARGQYDLHPDVKRYVIVLETEVDKLQKENANLKNPPTHDVEDYYNYMEVLTVRHKHAEWIGLAIKYTGHNYTQMKQYFGFEREVVESPHCEPTPDNPTGEYLQVTTIEGIEIVKVGDWVVRSNKNEYYACSKNIFDVMYEALPF